MHTTTLTLSTNLATHARRAFVALRSKLAGAYRAWRREQRALATARAMSLLDDRALRDIGLDRSELLSAAAEVHGQAERQRRWAVLDARQHG